MEPATTPKTYQDVKQTLRWYTLVASAFIALLLYLFLIPAAQRHSAEGFVSGLLGSPVIGSLGACLLLVGAFSVASWLLVFLFEFHDKIYDRYFIRWRHFYDLDVILPALTRPFGPHLDSRFFDEAEENLYGFMKPFYYFVGDGIREHKVTENLILRFYEHITKYWITQINEVLLIGALIIDFAYLIVYERSGLPLEPVVITTFIIAICFIANRVARYFSLGPVRRSTFEEIQDIHARYMPQLKSQLQALHVKFNLAWRD